MGYKQDFINFMAESGVLCFGEFKTKSGRLSPYFINTGNYCMGSQIALLGKYYAQCIYEKLNESYDIIYGPAYKGIPLAAATAFALYKHFDIDKAYCFNRKESKDHGEGGAFIGCTPADGQRVVIVDDVVTSGISIRESMDVLKQQADVGIQALIISVDRMERGLSDKAAIEELSAHLGIKIYAIVTLDDIVETLYNKPVNGRVYIDDKIMDAINDYRSKYCIR